MPRFTSMLGIFAVLMTLAISTASASPLTPPPPSACTTNLTFVADLVDAGPTTIDGITGTTRLDGKFDTNTGQLCDLSWHNTWKNITGSTYTHGGAGWICLVTTPLNCLGSAIVPSAASWTGNLVNGATFIAQGPWVAASAGQCTGGKSFHSLIAWENLAGTVEDSLVSPNYC
jgi:hypothetical protein